MLLTIVNLINYVLKFGFSFYIITLLVILIYAFIIYYFNSLVKTNKIFMTILIICIIVDLVCIMYLYSPTNKNNNDIIKNINTNKKEKTKKKNKKEKNKKNKTNKTKSNNTIKTFNEDVLTNIETYETIS